MEIFSMDSIIAKGKYADKCVSDLVNEKGQIIKMIKEGYLFDDEVLKNAGIVKVIRDENVYLRVCNNIEQNNTKKLQKETASVKQILNELNTITNTKMKSSEEDTNGAMIEALNDKITVDNFEQVYEE